MDTRRCVTKKQNKKIRGMDTTRSGATNKQEKKQNNKIKHEQQLSKSDDSTVHQIMPSNDSIATIIAAVSLYIPTHYSVLLEHRISELLKLSTDPISDAASPQHRLVVCLIESVRTKPNWMWEVRQSNKVAACTTPATIVEEIIHFTIGEQNDVIAFFVCYSPNMLPSIRGSYLALKNAF